MQEEAIIKLCKELSCCDACCLRCAGLRHPNLYADPKEYIKKYRISTEENTTIGHEIPNGERSEEPTETADKPDGTESPAAKRQKTDGICVCCLGILQEDTWPESIRMVKEMLEKKQYECDAFACALSAPMVIFLREKVIQLRIAEVVKDYEASRMTPLKEAWKWSFGRELAKNVDKNLDSGAVSPLLVTVTMEYADDLQELEVLKTLSPAHFESRNKQKKRFTVEFTRRCVEQALDGVALEALTGVGWGQVPTCGAWAKCVSAVCSHAPIYIGGRYIKLSRELPQTPWMVEGKRMMDSSVQEIIFEPIADIYKITIEDMEHRFKFMSAGREDVDVRCLGDGRPFAIEISDPRRALTKEELELACREISASGKVIVKTLFHIDKEDLLELKKGEETKCKDYEALCIKLTHSECDDVAPESGVRVTERDVAALNALTRDGPLTLSQRTPIRVLHRRPLLTRTRLVHTITAEKVPGHESLVVVRLCVGAGTYVKEAAHGDLARTRPAPLAAALLARTDILALDLTAVKMTWPNKPMC